MLLFFVEDYIVVSAHQNIIKLPIFFPQELSKYLPEITDKQRHRPRKVYYKPLVTKY